MIGAAHEDAEVGCVGPLVVMECVLRCGVVGWICGEHFLEECEAVLDFGVAQATACEAGGGGGVFVEGCVDGVPAKDFGVQAIAFVGEDNELEGGKVGDADGLRGGYRGSQILRCNEAGDD